MAYRVVCLWQMPRASDAQKAERLERHFLVARVFQVDAAVELGAELRLAGEAAEAVADGRGVREFVGEI